MAKPSWTWLSTGHFNLFVNRQIVSHSVCLAILTKMNLGKFYPVGSCLFYLLSFYFILSYFILIYFGMLKVLQYLGTCGFGISRDRRIFKKWKTANVSVPLKCLLFTTEMCNGDGLYIYNCMDIYIFIYNLMCGRLVGWLIFMITYNITFYNHI